MKRRWKIGIGVIVVLLIGAFFLQKKTVLSDDSSQVSTYTVKRQLFTKTISSSGKTKAKIEAELKFQTSGKLIWVGVKEGDTVRKGQVIAQIDSRDVSKSLQKTMKDYLIERSDFEESWRDNWPAAAESHEQISHAPTHELRVLLEKNQWNLEKAVLDVELKHLALEYASLVSPIAGVVTHVDTPIAGVNITPATAVFKVVDPSNIVFEANIDEVDVGMLSEGQKAIVSLDAFPNQTFDGAIRRISIAAETSAGGATVFPVEIQMASVSAVRVGYNGDVRVDTVSIPDAIQIPLVALREDETTKYVYKKKGKNYEKVTVATGESNEDSVIIESGITEGDEIVTKGFATISK